MTDSPLRTTRRMLVVFALVVAFLAGGYLWVTVQPTLEDSLPAPAFVLPRVSDGGPIELSRLKGKVVVLDFWATTCPPCLSQMEDLERIHRRYHKNGVVVLGINTDGLPAPALQDFFRRQHTKVSYPILMDRGEVSNAYRVSALPTTYVIGRDGKIHTSHIGYTDYDDIAADIRQALESGGAS